MTVYGLLVVASLATAQEETAHLEILSRVMPDYPDAARDQDLHRVRCLASVYVDEAGAPYEVTVAECPELFHAATIDALMQWRWQAYEVDGRAVRVKTLVAVNCADGSPPLEPWAGSHYGELVVAIGALHAPDDASGLEPAPTTGLIRVRTLVDLPRLPPWFLIGAEADLRGFRVYGAQVVGLVGMAPLSSSHGRLAIVTGLGWLQRGTGTGSASSGRVPVQVAAGLRTGRIGWVARGGPTWTFGGALAAADPLAPEVTGGLTYGEPVGELGLAGVRWEVGWRREWGADTWTLVMGMGQ